MLTTRLTYQSVCLATTAMTITLVTASGVSAQPAATYDIVSSFTISFDSGKAPSSLRQDSDGTFYGTTSMGGTFDLGTLFRMDATGAVTTLHHFAASPDVGQPFALVRATDGRFYGATPGTVFRFTPSTGEFTTLYTFFVGEAPPVDLFAASDGNVYGLLGRGGDFGGGAIFKIDPSGSVVAVYNIPRTVAISPSSLIKGSDGRFYVTATGGGEFGLGTVFAVDDAGTATVLHSFGAPSAGDGIFPRGLMQGRDGRLYGTTRRSSDDASPPATVYALDLTGNYQLLATFPTSPVPRASPQPSGADLLEASDGNFYGVIADAVYRVTPTGTLTTVRGALSSPGELIQGTDGRLYAPTAAGGTDGGGTIVAIDFAGTLTTMADFTVGAGVGGAGRPASIIERRDGQFLGTTNSLPLAIPSPPLGRGGTLFAMDAAGVRTTLHTFVVALLGDVFGTPMGNLFEGTDGTVYGTTYSLNDSFIPPGEVFKISPGGVYTRLALSNSLRAGVIQARDGNLYGVTEGNFVDIALRFPGKVFRVEANGTLTTVHAFQIDGDSFNPVGELVEIDDGSLYGTTAGGPLSLVGPNPTQIPGVIFRVDPTTGAYAVRYRFPERVVPVGRLIQGTDGLIYGTTTNGGASGLGTVFSLDAAGTLTTLHEFTGADGATPQAGVIQGSDGRLFGTTRDGGAFGHGTVFAMTVTGEFMTLHDFAMSDGANPIEELFQAHDGALYGTARNGGPLGGGVVFRVTLGTTTPPPANGYVEIVSRSSGKCLDVFGASTDPAAPVIQWVCTGGLNQQWLLEPVAGGAFRVTARHSGQALDVFGALTDDVTPLIQYPPTGGANQAWTLQPTSDGYVTFIAGHSGKAMDVEFASTDDGARVIQYSPTGGLNQQWLLRPVPSSASALSTLSAR